MHCQNQNHFENVESNLGWNNKCNHAHMTFYHSYAVHESLGRGYVKSIQPSHCQVISHGIGKT